MIRLRGTGKRPIRLSELLERYPDVMPDPGLVYGIQAPTVPGPPLLDPQATQDANAAVVARAMQTVARLNDIRVGKPSPALKRLASNAVPFFLKGQIAPLAWIAFSYDTWAYARKNAGTIGGWSSTPSEQIVRSRKLPRLPPTAWILQPKRFAAKASFFGWYDEKFRTRPMLRSKALNSLLKRFDHMISDLQSVRVEDVTRDFVIEAVECSFPDDDFRRMISAARKDCARMRQKLLDQIDEGVWIW